MRLSHDPTTRPRTAKRISDGKNKTDAPRCLKRYVARQVFNALTDTLLDEADRDDVRQVVQPLNRRRGGAVPFGRIAHSEATPAEGVLT